MVLDGLAADEQPLRDLRVGQSFAEQLDDLELPLGERADPRTAAVRPSLRAPAATRVAASTCRDDSSASKVRSAARASATASSGRCRGRPWPARAGTGTPPTAAAAWVNAVEGVAQPGPRVAQPGAPFRQRHQRVRVRRRVCLGARLELPDRLAAGPGRRPAGRRPARRAAGCTSCWPGRRSARRAGAGRGRVRSRRGPGAARPGPCRRQDRRDPRAGSPPRRTGPA